MRLHVRACLLGVIGAGVAVTAAPAQQKKCAFICAPAFSLHPSLIRSHLFGNPRVRSLTTGAVSALPSKTNAELQFLMAAPTAIPRTSLIASFQWLPTASTAANPFTEYTASQLGDTKVRANLPSVTLGVAVDALTKQQTGGWLTVSPYVADLYSNAQRPTDESAYTHKLDFGVTATAAVFGWLPSDRWLHHVSAFVILDYVATGLPKAGDEVPRGERVFLTGARPASLLAGLALPVAPLNPQS
jgi:hypothetical protein